MKDINVLALGQPFIQQHGDSAEREAARQGDRATENGDAKGARV